MKTVSILMVKITCLLSRRYPNKNLNLDTFLTPLPHFLKYAFELFFDNLFEHILAAWRLCRIIDAVIWLHKSKSLFDMSNY